MCQLLQFSGVYSALHSEIVKIHRYRQRTHGQHMRALHWPTLATVATCKNRRKADRGKGPTGLLFIGIIINHHHHQLALSPRRPSSRQDHDHTACRCRSVWMSIQSHAQVCSLKTLPFVATKRSLFVLSSIIC